MQSTDIKNLFSLLKSQGALEAVSLPAGADELQAAPQPDFTAGIAVGRCRGTLLRSEVAGTPDKAEGKSGGGTLQ